MPPIIAYHIVFSAYGFWLPNDPRGSGSDAVWARKLRRFGPPTKVTTRRSLAGAPHDAKRRFSAKQELSRPPVRLNGKQAWSAAMGIGEIVAEFETRMYALAIMPDHVHMVVARGRHKAEEWSGIFKRAATRRLTADERHPFESKNRAGRLPTLWAEGGWKVYLHSASEIQRAANYVVNNPVAAGLRFQNWSFVTPLPSPRGRGG